MALDQSFFQEMEARIPKGRSAPGSPPLPPAICTWAICGRPVHLAHRPARRRTFILRIEDTDQGRLVEGATDVIYRTMAECGLTHDEGPDVGGPRGPLYPVGSAGTCISPTPTCWWKRAPAYLLLLREGRIRGGRR